MDGISTNVDQFQSTLPVRGATLAAAINRLLCCISIHAPREGSDLKPWSIVVF